MDELGGMVRAIIPSASGIIARTTLASPAANPKDLHRPLRAKDRLDDAFAWRVERHVSQNLTLQYDKVLFLLEDTSEARDAWGKKVEVSDFPDGRVEVRYTGALLPYRTFDKLRRVDQAPVVDNKRLGPALEWCRQQQALLEPPRRSRKAPARRDQQPNPTTLPDDLSAGRRCRPARRRCDTVIDGVCGAVGCRSHRRDRSRVAWKVQRVLERRLV